MLCTDKGWYLGVSTPNDKNIVEFLENIGVGAKIIPFRPLASKHQYSLRNIDGFGDELHSKVDFVLK